MAWTTLHLKVVTPLFSSDDPGGDARIRVPSVRGALRFWLRAVAAGQAGLVSTGHLEALWDVERSVFGGAGTSSPIGLRMRDQPASSREPRPGWTRNSDRFDGVHYLLGQGLWSHRDGLVRARVEPGARFALDVRFSGNPLVDGRFLVAVWAWLTFGGLGARTRRGFGQLACAGVTGPLPDGWTPGRLARPTSWRGWGVLATRALPPAAPWTDPGLWAGLAGSGTADDLPEHPALHPMWWAGQVRDLERDVSTTDLGGALHLIGRDWRLFRAGEYPTDDAAVLPDASTRSPEWTDVIHGGGDHFPVAALGLPVNYFSPARNGRGAFGAEVSPQRAGKEIRWASPVWLRPVLVDDGEWALFSCWFAARLLPEDAELRLRSGGAPGRTLRAPDRRQAADAWRRWVDDDPRLPPGTDLRGV